MEVYIQKPRNWELGKDILDLLLTVLLYYALLISIECLGLAIVSNKIDEMNSTWVVAEVSKTPGNAKEPETQILEGLKKK